MKIFLLFVAAMLVALLAASLLARKNQDALYVLPESPNTVAGVTSCGRISF